MSRVRPATVEPQLRAALLDLLWTSVATLSSRDEVKAFFKDLLSESESIMLARRIRVAEQLLAGNTYDDIQRELRVGKQTIASVHNWLSSGFHGYETAVKRARVVFGERRERTAQHRAPAYSFEWIKRRYPLHFLLFNLLDEAQRRSRRRAVGLRSSQRVK